jgi:type 1 glutamine amidotransferase
MKLRAFLLCLICLGVQPAHADAPAVLVFTKTAGYRHSSIVPGIKALKELGEQHGFTVENTQNARAFTPDNLQRFAVVVFLSTTGNVLNAAQQRAFERYIGDGGGFVGIHAAADTEHNWPWYGLLVGARFDSHGTIQEATVVPTEVFGTAELPSPWVRKDEWYNFKRLPRNVRIVLRLDTATFKGSNHKELHPVAWYQEVGRGRSFYTALGHTDESFSEQPFLEHLMDGIRYAMGPRANELH